MNKTFEKILLVASCGAIAAGAAFLYAGQSRMPSDIPPAIKEAVVVRYEAEAGQEGGEAGQDGGIDWGKLPRSVIAWVSIPGTSIDYPVVRDNSDEPGYYLYHDAEGNYSAWGTPYVANGCKEGLDSPLVIIYGDNMSDGTMFADLVNYSDRAFAESHGVIILYTPQRVIHLAPIAVNVVNAYVKEVQLEFENQAEFNAYMAQEVDESEVVLGEVPQDARAYVFVTCSYETQNSRTVVYAVEKAE